MEERKAAIELQEKIKVKLGVAERKIHSQENYIRDYEKQIIKYTSENLEIKMLEE